MGVDQRVGARLVAPRHTTPTGAQVELNTNVLLLVIFMVACIHFLKHLLHLRWGYYVQLAQASTP